MVQRRPGDPMSLVASSAKIRSATGWKPKFDAIDAIVHTALNWRELHPMGYAN
jgi:UDP-glucose 4-epimerase